MVLLEICPAQRPDAMQGKEPPRRRSSLQLIAVSPSLAAAPNARVRPKLGIRSSEYSKGDQAEVAECTAADRTRAPTKEEPVHQRGYHKISQPLRKP
jgi:hypothetical protein